jgi:hypothetical protein
MHFPIIASFLLFPTALSLSCTTEDCLLEKYPNAERQIRSFTPTERSMVVEQCVLVEICENFDFMSPICIPLPMASNAENSSCRNVLAPETRKYISLDIFNVPKITCYAWDQKDCKGTATKSDRIGYLFSPTRYIRSISCQGAPTCCTNGLSGTEDESSLSTPNLSGGGDYSIASVTLFSEYEFKGQCWFYGTANHEIKNMTSCKPPKSVKIKDQVSCALFSGRGNLLQNVKNITGPGLKALGALYDITVTKCVKYGVEIASRQVEWLYNRTRPC